MPHLSPAWACTGAMVAELRVWEDVGVATEHLSATMSPSVQRPRAYECLAVALPILQPLAWGDSGTGGPLPSFLALGAVKCRCLRHAAAVRADLLPGYMRRAAAHIGVLLAQRLALDPLR